MAINSKYVQGNLIFHEAGRPYRWMDAFGTSVAGFNYSGLDFPVLTDNLAGWLATLVEGGAGESTVSLATAELGGGLLITTDAAENDGVNLQMKGEAFQCTSGKPFYFGAKVKLSEATQSDLYLGLAITTTDALGGVTDGVAFRKADGSTSCVAVIEKDSTETTATAVTMDTSYHVYEIVWDGTTVHFWVDGTQLTDPAQTNLPDNELISPVIHVLAGTTSAVTATVAWWRAWQIV